MTWATADGSATIPDMAGITSTNGAAGAAICEIKSPVPPIGTLLTLQLNVPSIGGVDINWAVTEFDGAQSIATEIAAQINANTQLAAAGVFAVLTSGALRMGITNRGDDLATLTDQSPAFLAGHMPSAFKLSQGSTAWDAGPIIYLTKIPGALPPVGSNMAQIVIGGGSPSDPGEATRQYFTIGFNVLDPQTGDCEMALYTADAQKFASFSRQGIVFNGVKIA